MSVSKTLSIYQENSIKKIDENVMIAAKKFNLSQYDEVMEKELGQVKNQNDEIFETHSDFDDDTDFIKSQVASVNLDVKSCYFCSRSYNSCSLRRTHSWKRNRTRRRKRRIKKENEIQIKVKRAVLQRRNNDTQTKIDKLRKIMKCNRFTYNPKTNKMMLLIPLVLKYFSPNYVRQNPMPIQSLRFYENVFPFDASLYCQEEGKCRSPFSDLKQFKRVYQIVDNIAKEKMKYFCEERDLETYSYEKFSKTFEYFQEWLQSLNNAKAKKFMDTQIQLNNNIQESIERTDNMQNSCSARRNTSENREESIKVLRDWQMNVPLIKKDWQKKLDRRTKKWMKHQPMLTKTLRTNLKSKITDLVSFTINYNFLNYFKEYPNTLDYNACFDILECFKLHDITEYYINNVKKTPNFTIPQEIKPYFNYTHESTYRNGDKIFKNCCFCHFSEKWVDNDDLYSRSYGVLLNLKV